VQSDTDRRRLEATSERLKANPTAAIDPVDPKSMKIQELSAV
jgi:hypothetical protein